VTDTGCGIGEVVREHLFEPFFDEADRQGHRARPFRCAGSPGPRRQRHGFQSGGRGDLHRHVPAATRPAGPGRDAREGSSTALGSGNACCSSRTRMEPGGAARDPGLARYAVTAAASGEEASASP
jgi:hypothetical protein